MSHVVLCPACGQSLQLPEALIGKAVRCPKCAQSFTAALPTVPCPVCQSPLPSGAESCGDCGYQLSSAPTTPTEPEDKPNVCPNTACATLNPPGERLCQRCNTPLPGATGQLIGKRYRLEKALATGGFGIVYRATDIRDGKAVAIKEMIAADPKEFTLRQTFFRREAEILKQLQQVPIVPRIYDLLEEGQTAYLALEFIPGDNLLSILEKPEGKPFPISVVATWGARICEVLTYMHQQSPALIHRDLKPENIMLLPDGATIRLIDFGTAREMGRGVRERGVAKTKVYTEGYAPPEQVLGKPEPRSDLFALAGTLYQLATGEAPDGFFTGRDILSKLPTYPKTERWFYELIAINLSEDLHDRYLTAKDFQADLTRRTVTQEVRCPKCSSQTPAREPYCRTCATALSAPSPACPKCEQVNLLGCRFCIKCGNRL